LLPTIGLILFIVIQNPFSTEPDYPLAGQIESIPNPIPIPDINEPTKEQENSNPTAPQENKSVVVDVKGQVVLPGVYTLSPESRVLDAIGMAGGLLPSADGRELNLAAKLSDEMVIYVPQVGETAPIINNSTASSTTNSLEVSLVNINTADLTQLMTLSGIGPSKANAILAYRDEHGLFKSIEDIKEVTGIGDLTFENIKNFISVN
jgi:competence protein ComEA